MQRIQKLLIVLAVTPFFLTACKDGKTPTEAVTSNHMTVSQFLHDIDAAEAVMKKGNNDLAKYANDANFLNASAAHAKTAGDSVMACWPKKPKSTAGTDHGCLDKLGYTR
jgi:hypothetical protein